MKKRKPRAETAEEITRRAERRAGFERSQRKLAERIAYHEARIAAEGRGDDPNAIDPGSVDASHILELDPAARHAWAQGKLAERIAFHEARLAAERRGEGPEAANA